MCSSGLIATWDTGVSLQAPAPGSTDFPWQLTGIKKLLLLAVDPGALILLASRIFGKTSYKKKTFSTINGPPPARSRLA